MMNSLWPIGGTSQLSFWNPLAEGTVALGGKAPQPRVRVGTQHVPQGPGEPAPSAHGGAGPVQGGLARCVHSRWGQRDLLSSGCGRLLELGRGVEGMPLRSPCY